MVICKILSSECKRFLWALSLKITWLLNKTYPNFSSKIRFFVLKITLARTEKQVKEKKKLSKGCQDTSILEKEALLYQRWGWASDELFLCWSGVRKGRKMELGTTTPACEEPAIPYSGSESNLWSGGDRAEWGGGRPQHTQKSEFLRSVMSAVWGVEIFVSVEQGPSMGDRS